MAEAPGPGQPNETVPNGLIMAELERALHQAVSENIVLRARIAMRDQQAAAASALPSVRVAAEQQPEATP